MNTIYESLMEGLQEDLKDIKSFGEPQGRQTVIEDYSGADYVVDEVESNEIQPIGDNWDDFEKEIFTPEEIAESNLRVALISELIDAESAKTAK